MFEEVEQAAERIKSVVHQTPVMTSRTLNTKVGAEVYLKCENFQKTGAFKFRGVSNAIMQLTSEQKQNGVFAFSSGNHAQALALVGQEQGIGITNFMPNTVPQIRRNCVESYKGEVKYFDPVNDDRESLAKEYQEKRGYTMIPPFNHYDVIYGQGTAVYELMTEIPDIDTIIIQCGGGGLLSGSAIAAKGLNPNCRVIGVEPELAADAKKSFESGRIQSVVNSQTIAFGLCAAQLGSLTFPLIQQYVDEFKVVSEAAIAEATRFLFYRMKLVAEPSGVVGLAALLDQFVKPQGRVGIVVSGGNTDAETMAKILKLEI